MQKTYKIVETKSAGEPIGVYADAVKFRDDEGCSRVFLEHGTTFTVETDTEKIWDKRGKEPVQIDTGREYVVAGLDIDIHPGCLTSIIRTGRAVDVTRIPAEPKPAKKNTAKRNLARATKAKK